jgi:hypothetical protein
MNLLRQRLTTQKLFFVFLIFTFLNIGFISSNSAYSSGIMLDNSKPSLFFDSHASVRLPDANRDGCRGTQDIWERCESSTSSGSGGSNDRDGGWRSQIQVEHSAFDPGVRTSEIGWAEASGHDNESEYSHDQGRSTDKTANLLLVPETQFDPR